MDRIQTFGGFLGFATLLYCSTAHAYVDPGTGTLLIQWAIGVAMASIAGLGIYWQRAKVFVRRTLKRASAEGEAGKGTDSPASD